jgi:uracil-DNA glycosylase
MSVASILEITKNCPIGWEEVFKNAYEDLVHIDQQLQEREKYGYHCYPAREYLFTAFYWTPLYEVNVVLIGQDPYPNTYFSKFLNTNMPNAHGASFSVPPDAPIPSSLSNIYRELKRSYAHFNMPQHGYLEHWGRQGILLLNNTLTVLPNKKESDMGLWDGFVSHVIQGINLSNPHCVYLLFGKKAQKIRSSINGGYILECSHPSGLSASRGEKPFIGSRVFEYCNKYLQEIGKPIIDWQIPPYDYQNDNKISSQIDIFQTSE